jgi:Phage-related lysozyme (muraminidase)
MMFEELFPINRLVTFPLSQNQFDALTSYVFNTGSLSGTKLLININQGNYFGAMSEMDIVTSRGIFMQGLTNRRAAEWDIWGKRIYVNH